MIKFINKRLEKKAKKRRIPLVYRKNRQWSAFFLYKIV